MTEPTDLFGEPIAPPRRAMGSHQLASTGADEWLTPPDLVSALGAFDLDPCSPGARRPWDTAAKHYAAEDNGLRQPWEGRVWLNPPYSNAGTWLSRLADHGHGTALIFARTETVMFFEQVWGRATGLLFLRGRLHFHYVDGRRAPANAGAPSVLVAYGAADAAVLADAPWPGHFVPLAAAVQ